MSIRKLQPDIAPRPHVLLNPGPCNTSARVKQALLRHDVCHRDPDYSEDLLRVTAKLGRIFGAGPEHRVLILTGSGTAAMEASIASCVPEGRKVLVVDNGAFGERLAEIARLHDMDVVHLRYEYGATVAVDDVRAALDEHPEIAVVAMVHHETSVGILNPIAAIGRLCRERDCLLLVDAVSSLGAEDLDVVRDHVDVCWGSANKCLHAAAGVSFVCVAPRVWPRVAKIKPRVFYLDLNRYRKYLDERAQTPFTPAVGTIYALEAACDEWLEDGRDERLRLYADRNRRLRDGLARLGFGSFTETGVEAHSIVTARLPDGVTFEDLYDDLKARGFVIYDCKPPLQGRCLQIANMGVFEDEALDAFLLALEERLAILRRGARRRARA
jgi:2-aminoethylphosphonate-pyruvate transaminase